MKYAQDVELVHARLATLENLRLGRFAAHLERLCLRENFLSHLDPEVFHLLKKLKDLDLYDNRLKSVGDALNNMTELS
jgi:protein phosphatase 1 regulatory subunit 7